MRGLRYVCIVFATVVYGAFANAAEVKVLSTGFFRGIYPDLIAKFEHSSGHKIALTIETPFALRDKLIGGFDADVVVATTQIMDDIRKAGKVTTESIAPLGQVYIAVAVRTGAAKPDLSNLDSVKHSIRSAKAVAISDPKGGAAIGRFILSLADKFSFDRELRSRFILIPGGGNQVAQAVLRGDADFGITISSEIASVKGVEIAGPLPAEMNQIGTAYGFLVPGTKQVEAGTAFIAFMRSAEARRLMVGDGIEPR